jgi:hypothetical protein
MTRTNPFGAHCGRSAIAALLGAAALLAALRPASAQIAKEPSSETEFASPQWFCFETKFGPYAPSIDSQLQGSATPFKDLFGSGSNLMTKWEIDLEFFHRFGTIAVGIEVGYYTNSAKAFTDNSADGTTPTTSTERTAGDTSINLVPLAALAIYRFDVLASRWKVPLVPYVKFGFNYTFWWINRGDGSTASYTDADGTTYTARGGTFGWQFNAGLMFLLDVLEPIAAKTLDLELGINHTYLFFEFDHIQADGFGSSKSLSVGNTTWSGGIAFEL